MCVQFVENDILQKIFLQSIPVYILEKNHIFAQCVAKDLQQINYQFICEPTLVKNPMSVLCAVRSLFPNRIFNISKK